MQEADKAALPGKAALGRRVLNSTQAIHSVNIASVEIQQMCSSMQKSLDSKGRGTL